MKAQIWKWVADSEGKIGIYPEGGKFVAITDAATDAELICRAVNAHEALVDALRRVQRDRQIGFLDDDTQTAIAAALNMVKA